MREPREPPDCDTMRSPPPPSPGWSVAAGRERLQHSHGLVVRVERPHFVVERRQSACTIRRNGPGIARRRRIAADSAELGLVAPNNFRLSPRLTTKFAQLVFHGVELRKKLGLAQIGRANVSGRPTPPDATGRDATHVVFFFFLVFFFFFFFFFVEDFPNQNTSAQKIQNFANESTIQN